MKFSLLMGISCLIILGSCTNNNSSSDDPFADCKFGKPEAIFKGDFEQVSKQEFQIKINEGIENVEFKNGMSLELIQKGCDKVIQIFQFVVPQKLEATQDWKLLAADQFTYLSRISEKHTMLGMWAQAIRANATNLQMGEKQTLQPGFSIKIEKVQSNEYTTLLVELSQD